MSNVLIPLSQDDCITLLETHDVGRICVVHDGFLMAFPVNYRLIELEGDPVLAIRTRTGNSLDHLDEHVGFEIDGVDPGHDGGWSADRAWPPAPDQRRCRRRFVPDGH